MAFRGALALLLLVAAAAGAAQAQLLTSAANALEWACSIPATDSGAYVVGTACFAQCDTTADPSITGRVRARMLRMLAAQQLHAAADQQCVLAA